MPRLFLHIGYHKTATTWLQNAIYPTLDEINYLGRYRKGDPEGERKDRSHIANDIALKDDLDTYMTRERLWALLDADKPSLLSQAVLVRPYHMARTVERLREVTDGWDVRIIMTIRRQTDLIFSRYVHDVNVPGFPNYPIEAALADEQVSCGYPMCVNQADGPACTCAPRSAKVIPLWFYDYFSLYSLYSRIFGAQRLSVFAMEELVNPETGALGSLLGLLGCDVSRYNVAEMSSRPKLNQGHQSEEIAAMKAAFWAKDGLAEQIQLYYRESNQVLMAATGLPLNALGYLGQSIEASTDSPVNA